MLKYGLQFSAQNTFMTKQFDALFPTINKTKTQGDIRSSPEDFNVSEDIKIDFTEQGEHLWFNIEKINSNTAWVASQLASACKVPARQVGFAGMKDRHAVTQQWFSVQLPKISDIELIKTKLPGEITVLEHHWHQSKLKTGQLSGNAFDLVVRNVSGDRTDIEDNIDTIKQHGVPNYFGPQRFGHDLNNMQQAVDWFAGKIKVNNKKRRGILISTARSHIFNLIVAERIRRGIWNQLIDGDIVQLDGSHSWFPTDNATETELNKRLALFDIHITAALWGEDTVQSTGQCAEIEQQIADTLPEYQPGFSKHRVKQDRRALRVYPGQFSHHWENDSLRLSFTLPPGAYATGVLREIIQIRT